MQEHRSGLQFGAEQRTQNSLVCSQIQSSQTSPLSHTSNYGIFSSCSLRSVERTNSLSHETVRLHELILEFLTKLAVRSAAVEPLSLSGTCCCRKSQFCSPPPHVFSARFQHVSHLVMRKFRELNSHEANPRKQTKLKKDPSPCLNQLTEVQVSWSVDTGRA